MNERNKTRWIIPEPIHIVERNEDSASPKGASGTSGGRPKRTPAEQQAIEYGHTTKREVGYLTIHSVLHLLGYDHVDEGPMKKQMRAREEAICRMIDLER